MTFDAREHVRPCSATEAVLALAAAVTREEAEVATLALIQSGAAMIRPIGAPDGSLMITAGATLLGGVRSDPYSLEPSAAARAHRIRKPWDRRDCTAELDGEACVLDERHVFGGMLGRDDRRHETKDGVRW